MKFVTIKKQINGMRMFMKNKGIDIKEFLLVCICSLLFANFLKVGMYWFGYNSREINYNVGEILVSLKRLEVYDSNKIIAMEIDEKSIFDEKPTNMTLTFDYSGKNYETIKENYKKQATLKNWIYEQIGNEIILSKSYGDNNIFITLKPKENEIWSMNIVNRK